jgi:hypothetical protein
MTKHLKGPCKPFGPDSVDFLTWSIWQIWTAYRPQRNPARWWLCPLCFRGTKTDSHWHEVSVNTFWLWPYLFIPVILLNDLECLLLLWSSLLIHLEPKWMIPPHSVASGWWPVWVPNELTHHWRWHCFQCIYRTKAFRLQRSPSLFECSWATHRLLGRGEMVLIKPPKGHHTVHTFHNRITSGSQKFSVSSVFNGHRLHRA